MKNILKRVISFIIAISLFAFCSLSVYASDHGGGGASSSTRTLIKAQESKENREKIEDFLKQYFKDVSGFFVYAASQVGCVLTGQYKDAYESWLTMEDIINETGLYINENGTPVDFYISTTLMKQIKQAIDDYAAENQPFKVEKTYKMSQIPASSFTLKDGYDYFKSFFGESYTYIVTKPVGSYGNITDITSIIKEGGGFVKSDSTILVYDADWSRARATTYKYVLNNKDENGNFCMKTEEYFGAVGYLEHYNPNKTNFSDYYQRPFIVTPDGGNIRVFKTASDFINYSVGQRKIYYTSNYYDYVPEDLQVSIDDLQKTIDDMQDVIDKLLDQIGNDTSESEIEELLRQILEALKNNPGGGGGGGDVNVDIDLSSTNTLLSKILAKVTQISDRISETAGGAADAVHAKMQETLDEMLVQIKKLKHWTMADTVVGAADAVADWLDLVKDLFSGGGEAAEGVVGAISSTMDDAANLMKTKFPFCIPWDVYLIVSFLAEEPQTPVFRLPIKLDRLGIDEYMEINLEDFEVVSSISRTLLTLLYCYALLNLTMKVFPITKEGGD